MSLQDKIKKIINVISETNINEIEVTSFWGAQKIRLSKKVSSQNKESIIKDNITEVVIDEPVPQSSNSQENNSLLCIITKDFKDSIHAGHIIKNIAKKIGIGGGGSQFMATMKIDNKISLEKVLDIGKRIIKDELK